MNDESCLANPNSNNFHTSPPLLQNHFTKSQSNEDEHKTQDDTQGTNIEVETELNHPLFGVFNQKDPLYLERVKQLNLKMTNKTALDLVQMCERESLGFSESKNFWLDLSKIQVSLNNDFLSSFVLKLRDMTQNNRYINLASLMLIFIRDGFPELWLSLNHLLENFHNPDLNSYVQYLLKRETPTFSLKMIKNPNYPADKNAKYALGRLNNVKRQLSKCFVTILSNMLTKKQFKSHFDYRTQARKIIYGSMFGNSHHKVDVDFQSPINEDQRVHFLSSHQLKSLGVVRNETVISRSVPYDCHEVKTIGCVVIAPVHEFCCRCVIQKIEAPVLYAYAKDGAILLNEGQVCTFHPNNQTEFSDALQIIDLQQSLPGFKVYMSQLQISVILSKPATNTVPTVEISHRFMSKFEDKNPTRPDEYIRIDTRTPLTPSVNTVFDLNRKDSIPCNNGRFHILSECFRKNQSVIFDPLVMIENLNFDDEWSLYLQYELYQGSEELIKLFTLANYLQSCSELKKNGEI